jgi:hypothetical protein
MIKERTHSFIRKTQNILGAFLWIQINRLTLGANSRTLDGYQGLQQICPINNET